jgi:hypothetical protein
MTDERLDGKRNPAIVLPQAAAAACLGWLVLTAGGCVSAAARTPLRLEEPTAWSRFELRRTSFGKRLRWRDLDSGRTWQSRYKGVPVSWGSPINIVVPERIYERRHLRGRFRFQHPLSGERLVLRAGATTHRVGTVPVPAKGGPQIEVLDGREERVLGYLAYDVESRLVFAGRLHESNVEIEQVDPGGWRAGGIIGYVVAPFPLEGEFVVRIDGREAARFFKQRPRGAVRDYDLALRRDAAPRERDEAALAIVVFALMEELVSAAV